MDEQNQPKQKVEVKQEKPKGPSIFDKLKERYASYKRIMDIARKPDKDEFFSSAKITGLGITAIGLIGFVIFVAYFLIVSVAP